MTNNKEKYAFWLTPEAKKMIEINAPLANCGSQSEFVEKAVRFYDGYLKVQTAGAFLPHAVADVLDYQPPAGRRRRYDTRRIQQDAWRQRPRGHQHTRYDLAERRDQRLTRVTIGGTSCFYTRETA